MRPGGGQPEPDPGTVLDGVISKTTLLLSVIRRRREAMPGCKRDDPGQIRKGETQMKTQKRVKMASAAVLTLGVIALTGRFSTPPGAQAQANHHSHHKDDDEASLVRIGFEIAPVPLNLVGKDPWKVGLGSFLVNAVGDCNGCHTGGGPPNFNYAAGGNPYFGQPTKTH